MQEWDVVSLLWGHVAEMENHKDKDNQVDKNLDNSQNFLARSCFNTIAVGLTFCFELPASEHAEIVGHDVLSEEDVNNKMRVINVVQSKTQRVV